MTTDIRESILVRLLAIAETADASISIDRNRVIVDPVTDGPMGFLQDGNEERDPNFDGSPLARYPVIMHPVVGLTIKGDMQTAGTTANAFRVKLLGKVLSDVTLKGYTLNKRGVAYDGFSLSPHQDAPELFVAAFSFAFTYLFRETDFTS